MKKPAPPKRGRLSAGKPKVTTSRDVFTQPEAAKAVGRGRPRKNGGGRLHAAAWLPAELVRQLDSYVKALQKAAPGASRGDVLGKALRTYRPFRRWLLKISARSLE